MKDIHTQLCAADEEALRLLSNRTKKFVELTDIETRYFISFREAGVHGELQLAPEGTSDGWEIIDTNKLGIIIQDKWVNPNLIHAGAVRKFIPWGQVDAITYRTNMYTDQ